MDGDIVTRLLLDPLIEFPPGKLRLRVCAILVVRHEAH